MYCRNCGREIKEGNRFCEFCGAPVRAQEIAPAAAENVAAEAPKKKGYMKWIIIAIVLVVVALAGMLLMQLAEAAISLGYALMKIAAAFQIISDAVQYFL